MHYHRHYPGQARCLSVSQLVQPGQQFFPPPPIAPSRVFSLQRHLPVSCYANFMLSFCHQHKICSLAFTVPSPASRCPRCSARVISTLHDNDTILTKLIMHNLNTFLPHCSRSCSCINPLNQPGGNSSDK